MYRWPDVRNFIMVILATISIFLAGMTAGVLWYLFRHCFAIGVVAVCQVPHDLWSFLFGL